jgi:hypothetical protein
MLLVILFSGSAFGTLEPCWMFADTSSTVYVPYPDFRYCDTTRDGDYMCYETQYDQLPDTGDTYDGSHYINFNYQFSSAPVIIVNPFGDTLYRGSARPGYAGFKTAWDLGMSGFPVARYKYVVLAHKGPLAAHKVTVRAWYNNGDCGAASYNELIGTFAASDTSSWEVDTIPIPESVQNKPDLERNTFKYYEMVFIINNLNSNDTTSGPPGCLKIDNIRLAGCNPIDTSPKAQIVNEGDPVTLRVYTSRADTINDTLTFQWKKDGADIAGADDSVYTLASAKSADAGTYTVAVTVSSTNMSYTSQGATLTVDAKEEGCGCGSGTGAALIPPLIFKAMAHRKRKKKNLKA